MSGLFTSPRFPLVAALVGVVFGAALGGQLGALTPALALAAGIFAGLMAFRNWRIMEDERPLLAEELIGLHDAVEGLDASLNETRSAVNELAGLVEVATAGGAIADAPRDGHADLAARLSALEDADRGAAEVDLAPLAARLDELSLRLDGLQEGQALDRASAADLEAGMREVAARLADYQEKASKLARAVSLVVAEARRNGERIARLEGGAEIAPSNGDPSGGAGEGLSRGVDFDFDREENGDSGPAKLSARDERAGVAPGAVAPPVEAILGASALHARAAGLTATMSADAEATPEPAADYGVVGALALQSEPVEAEPESLPEPEYQPEHEALAAAPETEPVAETEPAAVEPTESLTRLALAPEEEALRADAPQAGSQTDPQADPQADPAELREELIAADEAAFDEDAADEDWAEELDPAAEALAHAPVEDELRPAPADDSLDEVSEIDAGSPEAPAPYEEALAAEAQLFDVALGEPVDDAPAEIVFDADLRLENVGLAFQGVFALPDQTPSFFECFSRRREVDGDLSSRADHIRSAKVAGEIHRIDNVAINQCVASARKLALAGSPVGLFCNVSVASLREEEFLRPLIAHLSSFEGLSERIVFELSQLELGELNERDLAILQRIREKGFRFSLDHIVDWSVDVERFAKVGFRFFKVGAPEFLERVRTSRTGAQRLNAVFKELGVDLIVEKVEREEELEAAIAAGAPYAQGEALAPPREVQHG